MRNAALVAICLGFIFAIAFVIAVAFIKVDSLETELKEQTAKAVMAEETAARYAANIQELEINLDSTQDKLDNAQDELRQASDYIIEREKMLEQARAEISDLEADLEYWHASSASYKGKYNASQNELEQYEQLVTQLQAEAEQAQQQGSWLNLLSLLLGF
jgi:chromosome segregation ATPase